MQCEACRAIINCFCPIVYGTVRCNFCGKMTKYSSVPSANIVDYSYESTNFQPPLLLMAVDVTYEKGFDLIAELFLGGSFKPLLDIPGLRLGFVFFGTHTHFVNAEGPKIELITFLEFKEQFEEETPIAFKIPPLEYTYNRFLEMFASVEFK